MAISSARRGTAFGGAPLIVPDADEAERSTASANESHSYIKRARLSGGAPRLCPTDRTTAPGPLGVTYTLGAVGKPRS
jgi:hypothetical protein